jgi:hypothetical protein
VGLEERLALSETLGVRGASLDGGACLWGRDGVGAAKDGKDAEEQREEQGGEHRDGRGGRKQTDSGGVGWGECEVGSETVRLGFNE